MYISTLPCITAIDLAGNATAIVPGELDAARKFRQQQPGA